MGRKPLPILLGAHVSIAGGVHYAPYLGQGIGATTIQIFTANQRQWKSSSPSKEEVELWEKSLKETSISHVMSHDSYLINLGSPVKETLEKSRKAIEEEIHRCHLLQIPYLNIHPGAATTASEQECLDHIVESLLLLEPLLQSGPTKILLETMAGQGTVLGHRFEHLAYIIKKVHKKISIGVCFDTCHSFAAGYDIRTEKGWENTLAEFDQTIGLSYLCAFHLNDSQYGLGSRHDRHESIGKGKIGLECFRFLMNHSQTKFLPKYLETPHPELWADEIALLRRFISHKT